jgi:hypothetical protein
MQGKAAGLTMNASHAAHRCKRDHLVQAREQSRDLDFILPFRKIILTALNGARLRQPRASRV